MKFYGKMSQGPSHMWSHEWSWLLIGGVCGLRKWQHLIFRYFDIFSGLNWLFWWRDRILVCYALVREYCVFHDVCAAEQLLFQFIELFLLINKFIADFLLQIVEQCIPLDICRMHVE